MTLEIAFVLAILAVSITLFITEWIRMDVVALLVLGVLAISGLVSPTDALAGFSNPAVVTVWAMFILSAGLTVTGVAGIIGRRLLRYAGASETRLVLLIMLSSGILSGIMNNIGVAALMLPVVMDIARQTGKPPSRLLMPLAYGTLLGGLTTLIGTPPNLLASNALRESGLPHFRLFDFTPIGLCVLLGGSLFVAFIGRRLLPVRDTTRTSPTREQMSLEDQYALHERTCIIALDRRSKFVGWTLAETRLGPASGLAVLAVLRNRATELAPSPDFILRANDRLLVGGRLERLNELRAWQELIVEKETPRASLPESIAFAEYRVAQESDLNGKTIAEIGYRQRFGAVVLAVKRGRVVRRTGIAAFALQAGDQVLVQGEGSILETAASDPSFDHYRLLNEQEVHKKYKLQERLFGVRVPPTSLLVGKSLRESRLGEAFNLGVMAIVRKETTVGIPEPDMVVEGDDLLLVKGRAEDFEALQGLQQLTIHEDAAPRISSLRSSEADIVEVVLAPRSRLAGKTLRQVSFRDRFGLQVIAIWRAGRAYRSDLRDMVLQFGDALLLLGRREKIANLARETDFLVLTESVQEPTRAEKIPVAGAIVVAMVIPVLLGLVHISIAAVVAATIMVTTRCLTMEEAYRAIEWRPIFLIAGMLPLGVAMQDSGAANLLAENIVRVIEPFGPWGLIIGLYLATMLATTIIPTAALIVLMSPIAIGTAIDLGVSPHSVMMAVAMAASASFTSPIAHPANILVMGPGGYRFADYVRLGTPLAVVVMIIVLITLPIFWPLR